jgi:hypothetical protein
MSKHPLVATPIVNKNGVATTVHKRVNTGQGASSAPFPVPALVTKPDTGSSARVLDRLKEVCEKERLGQYGINNTKSLEYRLGKYSPEVIDAYDQVITARPGEGFEELLISSLHRNDDSDKAGFLLFIAQHDDEQDTEWDTSEQVTYSYEKASDRYYGIQSLDGQFDFDVTGDIYAPDDDRSAKIISALITVTNEVYNNNEWGVAYVTEPDSGYTLNNDSLIELIARRPEDANRIAEIVTQRSNPEASAIEMVLDAEVQPLRDGVI